MRLLLTAVLLAASVYADVQWSRFNGRVKGINGKTQYLTIQNKEGDNLTVKITEDVLIIRGEKKNREELGHKDLGKLRLDDHVTLLNMPKAPAPKDPDEPAEGGVYKPIR